MKFMRVPIFPWTVKTNKICLGSSTFRADLSMDPAGLAIDHVDHGYEGLRVPDTFPFFFPPEGA